MLGAKEEWPNHMWERLQCTSDGSMTYWRAWTHVQQ